MSKELQTRGNGQSIQTPPAQQEEVPVFTPRADVVETADELIVYADMPGVKPGDVDVRYQNGELVLFGRAVAGGPGQCIYAEYGVGNYYRAFTIAQEIDADKITAELRHGVLAVHLPKPEAARPRRIEVKGE